MIGFLSGLFGCGDPQEQIHIRIQNNSTKDISQFWLGTGFGSGGDRSQSYGEIARGEVTNYKALKPVYASYGKFNFITTDGTRYLGNTFPKEDVGYRELDPGYYTFVYTIANDEAILQIIAD